MVSRVHTLLPQSYDWSGADGKPGASEDKRERAEVQRAYYGFLNALAQNQLLQCLQVGPPHAVPHEHLLWACHMMWPALGLQWQALPPVDVWHRKVVSKLCAFQDLNSRIRAS